MYFVERFIIQCPYFRGSSFEGFIVPPNRPGIEGVSNGISTIQALCANSQILQAGRSTTTEQKEGLFADMNVGLNYRTHTLVQWCKWKCT